MSYYEGQTAWQSSRPNWEGGRPAGTTPVQTHFPRSHASDSDLTVRYTTSMKSEDPSAFGSQLDEVDRAVDNLVKSGKMFAPQRRDSLPVMGPRGFPVEHGRLPDTRMVVPMPSRHYSVQEFDVMRSQSAANLQNFYATQRFQPRPTEAEQIMQAKRRLAAQRERDLRNYHQEQQYNRILLAEVSGYGKDRVMSPSAMSEDERRELIARQHRALYTSGQSEGSRSEDGVPLDEGNPPRGTNPHSNGASAPSSNAGGTRGPSPMAFDPFGQQNGKIVSDAAQMPAADQGQQAGRQPGAAISPPLRSRTNSASSPSSKSASFSLFDNAQAQSSRTSASSPGGSPPHSQRVSTTPVTSGVAPIGTRPITTQNQGGATNNGKRASPPLNSPLYNLQQENDPFNNTNKERSSPVPSNNSGPNGQGADGLGWSKVWGPGTKGLSVWG